MSGSEYTVRLDAFEGPLDLLLYLIRKAEVEIADIPIARITDQYLSFLNRAAGFGGEGASADAGLGGIDVDEAGEFLVMAATLVEIKARTIMPVPEAAKTSAGEEAGPDEPREDPRAQLVKQLLEYKRFRDATDRLETLRREWDDRYPSRPAGAPEVPAQDEGEDAGPIEIGDLTLIDLVEAFGRIIETVDLSRVGEHRVVMDDTPVEVHAEEILALLASRVDEPTLPPEQDQEHTHAAAFRAGLGPGEMDFREVFQGRTRSQAIGMFLAVLELVKQQRVGVRQDETGRIVLSRAVAGVAETP